MHRYYDPRAGRYITSDPLGLYDGANTYAYVKNNPVNAVDPKGLYCKTRQGITHCSYPGEVPRGGVDFDVPATRGFPKDIRPGQWWYHKYNKQINAGNVDANCLRNFLKNNPTPGKPNAATAGGTYNNASPDYWYVPDDAQSPVNSFVTTDTLYGTPVIVNVTLPGHPLHPGYVARTVVETPEGTIINNFGEGTGFWQSDLVPLNDTLINNVWYDEADKAIEFCSCEN